MRRPMSVPHDFVESIGKASRIRMGVDVWRAVQLASAMRCSEQSVNAWARAGRIPPGVVEWGARWWTAEDLREIANSGIKPIAHYFPKLIANDPVPSTDPPRRSRKTTKPKKKGRAK